MPKTYDLDQILLLHRRNPSLSPKEISLRLGVSLTIVKTALIADGVTVKDPRTSNSEAKCRKVLKVLQENPSLLLNQVAIEHNTTANRVKIFAKNNGIKITARRYNPIERMKSKKRSEQWNRQIDVEELP